MRLRRLAFTLPEVIVACVIGTAMASVMTALLVRQQKFYSAATSALGERAQLRDAAHVLAADLRGAATTLYGLPLMTDTAIEMYSTIATSVTCNVPTAFTVGLPPSRLASGNSLTSMLVQPDTGDVALIFSSPSTAPDSGSWVSHRISAFTTRVVSTTCPPSTGFTSAADLTSGAPAFFLTLASAPAIPIRKGTPIHFLRRARYSLYRASDGGWYLGYRRCNGEGACSTIQPLSGPHRGPSGTDQGISFAYFDGSGTRVTTGPGTNVTRIDVTLNGSERLSIPVSPRNRGFVEP